jgi:hypothetical protein
MIHSVTKEPQGLKPGTAKWRILGSNKPAADPNQKQRTAIQLRRDINRTERNKTMKAREKRVLETVIRAKEYRGTTGVPTNALATALDAEATTVITAMEGHGTDQVSGSGTSNIGVALKRQMATELRGKLREISKTALGLDPVGYPLAAEQFRMPRSRTYQTLLATSRAFLEDVGPVKAGFVECGMPADFDEQLAASLATFATATATRDGGLAEQIGGTAGLGDMAQRGVEILIRLNAVMENLLKNNVSMLAAWKAASRIPSAPRHAQPPPTPPASPETPADPEGPDSGTPTGG